MKKIICLILSMLFVAVPSMAQSQGTSAVIEITARYNNPEIAATVTAEAVPGSRVGIMALHYGIGVTNINKNGSAIGQIVYIDEKIADENGICEFNFNSGNASGVCRIRLSGQLYDAQFTAEGNEVGEVDSGKLFSVAWGSRGYTYPEDMVTSYTLNTKNITENGVAQAAKDAIYAMRNMTPGRRMMYLGTGFENLILANRENHIFCDTGVENCKNAVKEFFREFYNQGGTVDFVYMDFEFGFSNWYFRNKYGSDYEGAAVIEEELLKITQHPLYLSKIRPRLEERNYTFRTDKSSELYDVAHYSNTATSGTGINYEIWNTVMSELKNEYIQKAVSEPILEFFPNVKISNYQSTAGNGIEAGYTYIHPDFAGGSTTHIGTHSSPTFYGQHYSNMVKRDAITNKQTGTVPATPFAVTSEFVNKLYLTKTADPEGGIMPWVHSYKDDTRLKDSPYYYEAMYHVMLYNPEPILFFGPYYYGTEEEEANAETNIQAIVKTLEVVNSLIADGERKPVPVKRAYQLQDYAISGMETGDKILWRYTPNLTDFTAEDLSVTTDEDGVSFNINGQTVTFPGGSIINTKAFDNEVGYFIETPKNTEIVQDISNADRNSGELRAAVRLFKTVTGTTTASFAANKEYTAVVRYENLSGEDKDGQLICVAYGEDEKMKNIKILDFSLKKGFTGDEPINLGQYGEEIKSLKFYLWDDAISPISEVTVIE